MSDFPPVRHPIATMMLLSGDAWCVACEEALTNDDDIVTTVCPDCGGIHLMHLEHAPAEIAAQHQAAVRRARAPFN